jgi:hypothetical protein
MPSARTVRPTDLVALVAYDGRVYPNEAVTRDRAGTEASPHPLEAAFEQWFSFATGRHTWISVKGATLRGLVSARRRASKAALELDCLIDAADDDPNVLGSLLERVAADAGRAGAERVFLRVPADSNVVDVARSAGFVPYVHERLLVATAIAPEGEPAEGLRRWTRDDAHETFRLYNRWTPEPVRRVEAATFREWQATRESIAARGTQQRVLEDGGKLIGWLRTAASGDAGRFDLMADPERPDALETLIDAAIARLRGQPALLVLVPDFAPGLAERLARRGFADRGEFVLLARRLVKPVVVPELAAVTTASTSVI